MLLSLVAVAVASYWIKNVRTASTQLDIDEFNATSPAPSLPIVDLNYTLQKANSYNSSNNYYTFSDIRYGESPTGKLRFAAPIAASENRTVQLALPAWLAISGQFTGPYSTAQTDAFYQEYPSPASFPAPSVPPADPTETEDCLFLDVMVPATVFHNQTAKNRRAPVLLWIYGGGCTVGYKTEWPPAELLKQSYAGNTDGLIFVAVNYRLGAFGWLAGGEGVIPNAGLLDQQLALQWVQDHINKFGGDPQQVTVMGESAGGGSILYLLTSPVEASRKTPLFQKAILQSPGSYPDRGVTQNRMIYQRFLELSGADSIEVARAAPAETLRKANVQIVLDAPYGQFNFGPVIDNYYVTEPPTVALASGQFQTHVSLVVAHNADEGILFTNPWLFNETAFETYVRTFFPAVADSVISYITHTIYPPLGTPKVPYTTEVDRAALFAGEVIITCNTYLLGLAYQNRTYNYLFDVPPAIHGDDLDYTFGPDSSTTDEGIRILLQDYITTFAETGSPNRARLPSFDMYGNGTRVLDLSPGSVSMRLDPAASVRCLQLRDHVYSS